MSNILNHNRNIFECDLNKEDYWDFHLCIDSGSGDIYEGLTERCLSSYIDISDDDCVWFDDIFSKTKYVWEDAVNVEGFSLKSFGYTSVDNGKTYYDKYSITNKEFFELFTNTTYVPNKDDFRLTLTKVRGNHKLYDYSNDIAYWNNEFQVAKLNGGWYQGFFCADDGLEYKTLPTDIGNGWNLEFVLNKEDFVNENETLNDKYPENKGIFFYIGTRAENKWWIKYLTDYEFDWCKKIGFSDDYAVEDYSDSISLNDDYFGAIVEAFETPFETEYMNEFMCNDKEHYVDDEYYEKQQPIDENMKMETEEGYDMYQPNIVEYKTDNKFLIFDRTCNGAKANDWDENTEFILNYIKKPDIGNYFQLFNRTCEGYDVNKVKDILSIRNKQYNVLQDIYRNALAFQIKDDGTIGYKYLVKDCDSEEENYKIESQFTSNAVIYNKLWYTINIKIVPVRHYVLNQKCLTNNSANDKMQIYIYVNGKLVLVSKELPILNLKLLNDLKDKQQGVPFNISLGGGTQGLAETVYLNYMKPPEYVLPLEKEFGGSFVGWFKSFRFYTCPLNYTEIFNNYIFNKLNDIYN